jgi:hypothetical protein
VGLIFEPLAPTAITLYMNQQLKRYKETGAIGNYKAHTKRLGKFHYRISLDLDLTGKQAMHLVGHVFPAQFQQFRRWFNDGNSNAAEKWKIKSYDRNGS